MTTGQILAKRIKARAKDCGKSVSEILKLAEITDKNFINRIESGTNVGYSNILKIAEELDCSVDYLLGRTTVIDVNKRIIVKVRKQDKYDLQSSVQRELNKALKLGNVTVKNNAAKRSVNNASRIDTVTLKKKDKVGV